MSWVTERWTPRDVRQERGALKPSAKTRAFGAVVATAGPPATQPSGIDDGSAAYAAQSGVGAPSPTQKNCDSELTRPVDDCANDASESGIGLRNSPPPPRTIHFGGSPSAWPRVQLKPARGLRCF